MKQKHLDWDPRLKCNGDVQEEGKSTEPNFVPLWRTVVLSFVGILESFVWISYGAYRAYNEETVVLRDLLPFLIAFSWVYAAIRPIAHPSCHSSLRPFYPLFDAFFCIITADRRIYI
jgi:hypothetical protein